jgi:uncharacterized cofD-like protein
VRRCLVALAGRRRLAEVFDHRFEGGVDLRDHSVGNIIIAALADMAGDFSAGVEQAARFLRARGRVLPAATESLTLTLHYADGGAIRGESTPREPGRAARAVTVEPEGAAAPAAAVEAIDRAHAVLLAPGSLFTSTIAALLGGGIREALARFTGPVVYIANLMTQPGETEGFTAADHLRAIHAHAGDVVTDVVVDSAPLSPALQRRYEEEGASRVVVDHAAIRALGVRVHERALHTDDAASGPVRHDPARVAAAVLAVTARAR